MYIRMFVLLLISLYSSRLLLNELGVDDYGIFNLVGSVIAMVSMIKGMFSSSTQRFLNYEMGKGNFEKLQTIFNMSIYINIIISVIFVFFVESIGMWFIEYKINIDPSRLYAAKWVFHLSVISTVITIMTTPFDAVIIANEKMNIYALISIFDGILRLIIIFMIPFFGIDKLIIYAVLLLLVSIIIRLINTIYCHRNFRETHYKRVWNKDVFKEMFSFAGWQLFGTTAYTLTNNGLNMLLNIFGGPAVNAARGVAYQVNGAINQFLSNVTIVTNPYSIKSYAEGKKEQMFNMMFFSSKILFIIELCLIIPIIFITYSILKIWLGIVPEYAVGFVKIILIWSLLRSIHTPIDTIFKAVGKIKVYQITEGILLSMPLLFSYIALKQGNSLYIVFYMMLLFEIINFIVILLFAKKIADLNLFSYFEKVILPCIICLSVGVLFYLFISFFINSPIYKFGISILADIFCLFFMFIFGFNKQEKRQIISIIKK